MSPYLYMSFQLLSEQLEANDYRNWLGDWFIATNFGSKSK